MSQRRIIHIDTEGNAELQAAFAGFKTGDQVTCEVRFIVQSNDQNKGIVGVVQAASEPRERPAVHANGNYTGDMDKEDSAALVVLMKGKGGTDSTKAGTSPQKPEEKPAVVAAESILG